MCNTDLILFFIFFYWMQVKNNLTIKTVPLRRNGLDCMVVGFIYPEVINIFCNAFYILT